MLLWKYIVMYVCTYLSSIELSERKSVVTDSGKEFFHMLSKDYMTDESDGSSDKIILHKHDWRSMSKDAQMCI